ncbi:lysophospholipid acyltransferase family protein [Sphingobacterium paludis]|uniref:Lauroyl/myristoyl acyltransferase n=1 Tax=Sphingobacterium paludis TaxID=1476465 RepID=A0A4R7CU66_9SPHI|nr:hypothetical protein [Sphingobacterium paludis]TDS06562.1 lauroyl/myristoyl acyltransferase [Sphingobacterium paludis]
MPTIQFKYQYPAYDQIRSALDIRLLDPSPNLIAEWARFDPNIRLQFPGSDHNWRYWQFEQACFNQSLAIAESNCRLLEDRLSENVVPAGYFKNAGIIATFHFASYRIIGKWLAASSIKFVLLVSGDVKDSQEAIFHEQIAGCLQDSSAFYILNANDPRVILKIRTAIRQGYMVLIYVDGNVGGRKRKETITLLHSEIAVRSGVFDIAQMLGVPIYPIYADRGERSLMFNLVRPLSVCDGVAHGGNTGSAGAHRLYGVIKDRLAAAPYLWENWFHLDEFA